MHIIHTQFNHLCTCTPCLCKMWTTRVHNLSMLMLESILNCLMGKVFMYTVQ